MNLEQELKIALNENEYALLSKEFGAQPILQTNYYFFAEDMPRDTVVRLRKKGGKTVLCCKRLISDKEGVKLCDERETEVDWNVANSFIANGIAAQQLRLLLGVELNVRLAYVGELDTYRAKFAIEQWQAELDKNVYLGVTDYELECENDSFEQLQKLKEYLLDRFGIVFRTSLPKSERFAKRYFSKQS